MSNGDSSGESLRIGVFICHCGRNIAGYLDTKDVTNYASTLPGVVFSTENHYSCSEPGMQDIRKAIEEQQLNRVVVAACTPRTHEPLFRETCKEAGLNPYLFEFVNIREQCSWVHSSDWDEATCKAKDLVRMGITKAALLEPAEEIEVKVKPSALVVGGGVAGMTAATSLARRGFSVHLVEREKKLGGRLRDLGVMFPAEEEAVLFLERLEEEVRENENIEVFTKSTLNTVQGFIGNYVVEINSGKKTEEREVGTIIVATGADILEPKGLYKYDGKRVITHLHLENILRDDAFKSDSIVMIQCVGSRNEERPYCSKICCIIAVKNAILIKQKSPDTEVTILYRDLQMHGVKYERYLKQSRDLGVRFIQYKLDRLPIVTQKNVRVYEHLLDRELDLPAELVVLSTAYVPWKETKELSQKLRVPVSEYGFLLEAHAQLRPVEFATDGIYLCGAALWPSDISETIFQAQAAASKASIPMSKGSVLVEPVTCVVDPELCRGCGVCESICDYHGPKLEKLDDGRWVAAINEALCKGCGTCAAMCPTTAITARQFTDKQLLSMMDTMLADWHMPMESK